MSEIKQTETLAITQENHQYSINRINLILSWIFRMISVIILGSIGGSSVIEIIASLLG